MPNIRMTPGNAKQTSIVVNGRPYTCAYGSTIDVADFDAHIMDANGWSDLGIVGPTSARPVFMVNQGEDSVYIDTTLGYMIVYDGVVWRNPVTGAIV